MNIKAPWLNFYGDVPKTLEYPDCSMADLVYKTAEHYPDNIAYDFMGDKSSYKRFVGEIETCARAFYAFGIKSGQRVAICLPNLPQGIICFYALNKIGAIPNMIHPLSSAGEIKSYISMSESVAAVTLDQFADKFCGILKENGSFKLIVTSIMDALAGVVKLAYRLTQYKKYPPIGFDSQVILWRRFMDNSNHALNISYPKITGSMPAAILYSGGTTGTTKGVLLSNLNFNALALQTAAMSNCCTAGNSMLAVMPIFHGFGLGVCIHTMLVSGCKCILIPRFNAQSYAKLLKTKKPNYIAGVPTLYEAIIRNPKMKNVDLSCLLGVFSGGDSLSISLKKKFDQFLLEHNAKVKIREGYGTTECVTASCLTPYNIERQGSIGLPFPDTYYKIVKVDTIDEVDYGTEGEICISGPSVMLGYINHQKENEIALKTHDDGRVWLHTGDLGVMDSDGFVYFRQRIKRMIITNGYSVYPSQLENIIDAHPDVLLSCVIGMPDPIKMQKIKAFIVLKDNAKKQNIKQSLFDYMRQNIAKYAIPYDIEFRDELPKTLVGKVAYTVLEKEELDKIEKSKA